MRPSLVIIIVCGIADLCVTLSTEDWSLTTQGTTMEKINASMTEWLTGPKTNGLMILEHELSDESVQAFLDAWPVIKSNGWNTMSMARLDGGSAYQNADDNTGDVNAQNVASPRVGAAQPIDPNANAPGSSSSGPSSSASPSKLATSVKPASSSGSSSASAASTTPTSIQSNTNSAMHGFTMSSWSMYTFLASTAAFGAFAFF